MPLFRKPIEQEFLNLRLREGRSMTELEFYARELTTWETSPERREMIDGDRYYNGDHDILKRKRTAIGDDGKLIAVENLPNNRIVDNQYAKHVDIKANYILGQPVSFLCENKEYAAEVKKVLGSKFMRTLKNAGVESLNGGIAWIYPYYDKNGQLAFQMFPGYEIMPFWADAAHTELDSALRLYPVEVYYGTEKKIVKKVDIFTLEGIATYIFENGTLVPDAERQAYIKAKDSKGNEQSLNWEHFPLIPIKCNPKEIPLIRRGRSLQDAINLLQSDFVNNMEEDVRNTILVIKNYDGQDLGEFRRNLTTYGAVKVRSVEGVEGGVESLSISVDSGNYKTVIELLKKALIENMRSYDAKDDRLSGTPNQMNIQSMYCDIDLDANAMETELQAAFEEVFWFVNTYLANTGKRIYTDEDIMVIFNRDILINESEVIENCGKSAGIISNETIIAMHPWVDDQAAELERLEKEKEEADPYRAAFEQAQAQRNAEDGDLVDEE